MDLTQLKQILTLAGEHGLSELEIEHEGLRLRIRRDVVPAGGSPAVPYQTQPPAPLAASRASAAGAREDDDHDLLIVKSPIVGTFYRSPEPGAPPFVEVGAIVKKGQVLCIIEAMKLMNEIDSEVDGEVLEAYVETGQPVQYGERLFAIRRR